MEEEEDYTDKRVLMKTFDLKLAECITMTQDQVRLSFNEARTVHDDWRETTTVKPDILEKFTPTYDMPPNVGMINIFDFGFNQLELTKYIQSLWETLQPQLKLDAVEWDECIILQKIKEKSEELKKEEKILLDQLKDFILLVTCDIQLGQRNIDNDDKEQLQFEISYHMINSTCRKKYKQQPTIPDEGVKFGSDLTATWAILEQLLNHALTCCESNTLVDGGVHESSPPVATQLRYSSKCTSMDLSSARL